MIAVLLAHLQFSGKIGAGTLVTIGLVLVAVTTYGVRQWRGGDPKELRDALALEIDRRRESDEDRKKLALELAAQKAKTDLTGLEDRMTRRMDIFEQHAKQQTEILEGLVAAVTALVEKKTVA